MATKKVVPANPDANTAAKVEDKTASRKTACGKVHPRKTGRKSSSFKVGH